MIWSAAAGLDEIWEHNVLQCQHRAFKEVADRRSRDHRLSANPRGSKALFDDAVSPGAGTALPTTMLSSYVTLHNACSDIVWSVHPIAPGIEVGFSEMVLSCTESSFLEC